MGILDNVPLATITFLAGVVLVAIAAINNNITLDEALKDLGALGAGTGLLGVARAASGKGIKKQG